MLAVRALKNREARKIILSRPAVEAGEKLGFLPGDMKDKIDPYLHTDEVLVALSVLSQHNDDCRRALTQLPELRGCQVHSTVMLSEVDRKIFKKLGCGLTCDPAKKPN